MGCIEGRCYYGEARVVLKGVDTMEKCRVVADLALSGWNRRNWSSYLAGGFQVDTSRISKIAYLLEIRML